MRTIMVLLYFVLIESNAHSQDAHFSMFNEMPIYYNPAATANSNDVRVVASYRNQWATVSSPFNTYGINADFRFKQNNWKEIPKRTLLEKIKNNAGMGITIVRDIAGDLDYGNTLGQLTMASSVTVSKESIISLGIGLGFGQRGFNSSEMNWGTSLTPGIEPIYIENRVHFDASTGIQWKYGRGETYITANDEFKAVVGISLNHLNNPKYSLNNTSDNRLTRKWIVNGGFIKGIKNTRLFFQPMGMVSLQGPSKEIVAGMIVKQRTKDSSKYTGFIKEANIYIGSFVRFRDALIFQGGIELGRWAVGFSYDVNSSMLTPASKSMGGFEFALRFMTPNPFLYMKNNKSF